MTKWARHTYTNGTYMQHTATHAPMYMTVAAANVDACRRALIAEEALVAKEVVAHVHVLTPPQQSSGEAPAPASAWLAKAVRVTADAALDQRAPVPLFTLDMASLGLGVREVSCGTDHAGAILYGYEVLMWGANDRGQLGLGDTVSWCIPRKVDVRAHVDGAGDGVDGGRVASIACGDRYTMCVWQSAGGGTQVLGWGRNDSGQLGLNQLLEIALWIRSMALNTGVRSVMCGARPRSECV
jgi:hypothetical protein